MVGARLPGALGNDEGVRDVGRVVDDQPDGEHLVRVRARARVRARVRVRLGARGVAGGAQGGAHEVDDGDANPNPHLPPPEPNPNHAHEVDDGDAVDGEAAQPHEAEDVDVDLGRVRVGARVGVRGWG